MEVHPPDHAIHTWRDFFIHIATIVVGLLIAIGLEQTVEYFHHRHQMHIARERIRQETEVNQRIQALNRHSADEMIARLDQDLAVLDNFARTRQSGTLDFHWNIQGYYDAAYNSARESGALALMPYDEAAMYSDSYVETAMTTQAMFELLKQMEIAQAATHGHALSDLPPADVQTLVAATSEALGKAHYLRAALDVDAQELQAVLSGHFRNDIAGTAR
jgi:hypothetical protein